MEPSCIEHTTMHDHMNRRKIFGKPANGRMVGYVTRMQKRRPPYVSMKCLPCRDNFPKCFFRWCIFPLMFSRIEMCFFFMKRYFFFKDFVCVDILSFKSFPNGHFLVEVSWCIEIFTECFCCLDTFDQLFWYRTFRFFFDGTLLV